MQSTWSATTSQSQTSNHTADGPEPVPLGRGYRFQRFTDRPTETLGENGIGGITRSCGLVRSAFRPSDDATTFPYLVSFIFYSPCTGILMGDPTYLFILFYRYLLMHSYQFS